VIRRKKSIPKQLVELFHNQNKISIVCKDGKVLEGCIYDIQPEHEIIKLITDYSKVFTIEIRDILRLKE